MWRNIKTPRGVRTALMLGTDTPEDLGVMGTAHLRTALVVDRNPRLAADWLDVLEDVARVVSTLPVTSGTVLVEGNFLGGIGEYVLLTGGMDARWNADKLWEQFFMRATFSPESLARCLDPSAKEFSMMCRRATAIFSPLMTVDRAGLSPTDPRAIEWIEIGRAAERR